MEKIHSNIWLTNVPRTNKYNSPSDYLNSIWIWYLYDLQTFQTSFLISPKPNSKTSGSLNFIAMILQEETRNDSIQTFYDWNAKIISNMLQIIQITYWIPTYILAEHRTWTFWLYTHFINIQMQPLKSWINSQIALSIFIINTWRVTGEWMDRFCIKSIFRKCISKWILQREIYSSSISFLDRRMRLTDYFCL